MNLVTIDESLWNYEHHLVFNSFIQVIVIVFILSLIIASRIIYSCFFKQDQRKNYRKKNCPIILAVELYIPSNEYVVSIPRDVQLNLKKIPSPEILFPAVKSCILYALPANEIFPVVNAVLSSTVPQPLIYYVDGSYSHHMQIGHSGFLASDGSSLVNRCIPQYPRRGCTESEVYAVCLAIQHAMENHYGRLIIHTDNSKVEQLLCRPKNKDNYDYPLFCQIFNKFQQESSNNIIQVERVRGHTTSEEQNQCEIKRQFAKIDRRVRRKNRRYIRRQRNKYRRFYRFWYLPYNSYTYYEYEPFQYFYF